MNEETVELPPDDALAEIAEHAPSLTTQETYYVYWRIIGTSPIEAFRKAGYKGSTWKSVETRPKIREAIAVMHEHVAPEYRVTQKKIIGILMDAVDLATRKEQAGNLIEAARALADISGVGAATKVQIQNDISVTHKQEVKAISHMPRGELEHLLEIKRALPNPAVIDGEYVEIDTNER